LRTLIEKKAPIVYIGHLHHFDKGLHVYAQYTQYLLSVLTYFQSNGHHKILFIGARKPDSIQSEWEDMNVTIHKTLSIDFVEAVFDKEQLCQMITDRFSSQNRPSAIFCENLSDIQPIISSLNQLHLSIPEDVSIISVEHFKDAGVNFYPKITNVYVPVFEMGQAAIQLLMDYINGKLKSPYDFQLTIESKLIERDSVRNIATD
jgi:LacI family transcriptional regulator